MKQRLIEMVAKKRIPFSLTLTLISMALFLLSFLFLSQSPRLDLIQPSLASSGSELVLSGAHFGDSIEQGTVSIAGEKIPRASIKSWESSKIVLTVPREARTGSLVVETSLGLSRGILFTVKNRIPELIGNAETARREIIETIEPSPVIRGQIVTIRGRMFGNSAAGRHVFVNGIAVAEEDLVFWSNSELRFIMPATSLNSNQAVLSIGDLAAREPESTFSLSVSLSRQVFESEANYLISIATEIGELEISKSNEASLIVYLPKVLNDVSQHVLSEKIDGSGEKLDRIYGLHAFSLSQPDPIRNYKFEVQTSVSTRSSSLIIDGDPKLSLEANLSDLSAFLSSSPLVPLGDPKLKKFVKDLMPANVSLLEKSRLLYEAILQNISPSDQEGLGFAAQVLIDRKAGAFGYANLMVACARLAGVPARLIGGVRDNGNSLGLDHYWAELLIPGIGWINVDPYLADHTSSVGRTQARANFYFGGIDKKRVALMRGDEKSALTRNDSGTRKIFQRFILMAAHAESGDGIDSYGLFIPEVSMREAL